MTAPTWFAVGISVWHRHRDGDTHIASCDSEDVAALVAAAPQLLSVVQPLLDEYRITRESILQSITLGGDVSTADPDELAYVKNMDKLIDQAQRAIDKATGRHSP